MTELENYIHSYFNISDKSQLSHIGDFFQLITLKKGDFLFKKNQNCDKLVFIKAGYLRIYDQNDDKEITQWISCKGYFVTDLEGFLFNKPCKRNIQALSEVEIYSITKINYLKLNNIVSQWNELEKLFIAKCFSMLEDRIYSHLSMSSEERYAYFFENNKELFNQVPLQYIASMLGMTPETFSRVRKKYI
jgi:CRP-like cAMP-binding protein